MIALSSRKFLRTLSLALLIPWASLAGEGGAGTRNGGHGFVDINGIPHLRDLHDHCRWRPFRERFAATPLAAEMLEALKRSHWILGEAMDREIDRMRICATGTLAKIAVDNLDSITVFNPSRTFQHAIRVNEDVYVDVTRLPVTAEERAVLLLHEIVHAFIPDATESPRNFLVQTLSFAILDNYRRPLSPEAWAITLEKTEVTVPAWTTELDADRSSVSQLFDFRLPKKVRYELIEQIGLERLEKNLFVKDFDAVRDEITTDYSEAFEAMRLGHTKTLTVKLMQGVKAEFPAIESGETFRSLLEFVPEFGNEAATVLILNSLRRTSEPSDIRKSVLLDIAKKLQRGQFTQISLNQLVSLGLPTAAGLQIILSEPIHGPKSFERMQKSLAVLEAAGIDLNRTQIPSDEDSAVLLSPFAYALRKNPQLAAYILSLPSSDLSVLQNPTLRENETKRNDFLQVLARQGYIGAVRKVLELYPMRAFDRMRLAGFTRAEKSSPNAEIIAELIETTSPHKGGR